MIIEQLCLGIGGALKRKVLSLRFLPNTDQTSRYSGRAKVAVFGLTDWLSSGHEPHGVLDAKTDSVSSRVT
jgi:hypothetical protein